MTDKIRTINVMSGLPGSGKTTYVKKNALRDDICLHRDDFRGQLRRKCYPRPPKNEWKQWITFINYYITVHQTRDIFIDQTTIGMGGLLKLLKGLRVRSGQIIVHVFNLPFDVIQSQNENENRFVVPSSKMRAMYRTHTNEPISQAGTDSIGYHVPIIVKEITK